MSYSSPHHVVADGIGAGAVLVDSCLCFIHNFRRHPHLRPIILRHFSPNSLRHSLRLLSFLQNNTDPLAIPNIPDEDLLNAILVRLDQICASAQAPVFAAADLICLPFRPFFAEEDGNLQIEEELRQIRFLLQDWLLQRRSDSHLLPAIPSFNLPAAPTHFGAAITSSPEFPTPNSHRPIQRNKSPSPNQQQQYSSASASPSSPTKGHRISQVLQKLTTRGKEAEMVEIGGENDGKDGPEMAQKQQQIPSISATFHPPPLNSTALAFVAATQMQLFQRAAAFAISQQQSKMMATPEMDGGGKVGENDDEEKEEGGMEQPAESHDSIEMEEEHNDGEGAEENYANADAQSERTTIIGQTKSPTAFSEEDGGTSSTNSRGGAEMEEEGGEEKPFFCPLINCRKRFANKFLLKKHQFIHSGQKPHICQFCQKTFNRKDNLLRHKKTHLQNGMAPVEGSKRRHNMLRGISEEMAKKMQLLPSNYREGGKGGGGQSGTGRKSNKASTTVEVKKEAATA